ncbi:methyltransferase domain-containing protein [Methylotetracoccus oryzae]|uniref:methyltransferase domain-containing protein n=1 Tax=Methylotetracoccus oryzae TaxID=1919059 RepID=UPI00111B7E7E|nr:methyltransferase domain-containing protein [Methylotetracoccus oryzae]
MRYANVTRLSCPFCDSPVTVKKVNIESDQGIDFGLLDCKTCHAEFPIVAGVLITIGPDDFVDIRDEVSETRVDNGVKPRLLCELLAADKPSEAFSLLLRPCRPTPNFLAVPSLAKRGPSQVEIGRVRRRPLHELRPARRLQALADKSMRGRLTGWTCRRAANVLLKRREQLSAMDVIDFYYRNFSLSEVANYFGYRFGQPRHLSGLQLASHLRARGGPTIDLACGAGHLTHHFSYRAETAGPVIGVDRDYFRLYLAQNFVAPDADFICQWVDRPLPFPARSFDNIFCSDAFHVILNKSGFLREARRLMSDTGVLALATFGNRAVRPQEGYELTAEGYRELFRDSPHVILGEDELLESYFAGTGPDFRPRSDFPPELHEQKWFNALLTNRSDDLRQYGRNTRWPHLLGRIGINPIYHPEQRTQDGALKLRFKFPSEWYAYEDRKYTRYAPESVELPPALLDAIEHGSVTEVSESLASQLVLVGLPDRYL